MVGDIGAWPSSDWRSDPNASAVAHGVGEDGRGDPIAAAAAGAGASARMVGDIGAWPSNEWTTDVGRVEEQPPAPAARVPPPDGAPHPSSLPDPRVSPTAILAPLLGGVRTPPADPEACAGLATAVPFLTSWGSLGLERAADDDAVKAGFGLPSMPGLMQDFYPGPLDLVHPPDD